MLFKYPRTLHLPISPGISSDDKKLSENDFKKYFYSTPVVITEKLDGENSTLYSNYIHARSLDSRHHPSRDWVKRFHSEISYKIPEGWRVCGENMFARHSVSYDNLDSYFYGFSIWDENNVCLSWEDTKEFFEIIGVQCVPELECQTVIQDLETLKILGEKVTKQGKEGYVIRRRDSFHYNDFYKSVAKYVRANHVQTDNHWMSSEIVPNKLKED